MVMSPRWRMARAAAAFSGVSLRGRPPRRPAALAISRPAWLRSRISSRSNSASAANRCSCSLPGGGGGVDRLAQRQERDVALLELAYHADQVVQAAAEAVQPPHHERVAVAHVVQAGVELRAATDRAGHD